VPVYKAVPSAAARAMAGSVPAAMLASPQGPAAQRQPQLDPRHFATVLPGRAEAVRRIAQLERAAGVAFELISAALAQIAGDRQEPAWDAFGVGARVPDVLDLGVVRSTNGTVRASPAWRTRVPTCRWMALISWMTSIMVWWCSFREFAGAAVVLSDHAPAAILCKQGHRLCLPARG
jgi:hypothetical protein